MKLYVSSASPYVRKCLVLAHELGLYDQIEQVTIITHPIDRNPVLVADNPLGKIPALFTDTGDAVFDSRVICEYLNDLAKGSMFPDESSARWVALVDQALADGMLDAALLARYEASVRPKEFQWQPWADGQMQKITSGLARFDGLASELAGRIDIGTIALACALSYLDLRFQGLNWREAHPALGAWYADFSKRPSMQETVLRG